MVDTKQIKRWRLILGEESKDALGAMDRGGIVLSSEEMLMDEALAAIYDKTDGDFSYGKGGQAGQSGKAGGSRSAGKGPSSPMLAKWLADIRTFFPEDVVSVIQADAIEKKGLKQLLFEPETLKNVKPDVEMVATLMSLKGKIPERTKDTARELVRKVVEEINKKLENNISKAVTGALNKKDHTPIPSLTGIDWRRTISKNLKNYDPESEKIIPERFYYYDRAQKANKWTVILDMDQSGSMSESIVYGSIVGCIFASMSSLKTHVIAFDTEVADLTDKYGNDPVDMIFGIQLGGGTDINKSVAYCQQYITQPAKTLFILLTDLYEGGNLSSLYKRMEDIKQSGVKAICLLALSDRGQPSYDEGVARRLATMGIPCFACTPNLLPDLVEGTLKGFDLKELAKRLDTRKKR